MKHFNRKTQHLRQNFLFGFLAIGLFLVLPALTFAAPGDLDLSFGSGGKVITPIGSSHDFANSVAIQSDGKIVAAGNSDNGANSDFAVVRYNTNGSLDTSFNGTGKVTTPIGSSDDFARSVAIQADGKIVAAGFSDNGANYDFAVVRYNADGSLDTSFGGTGKVVTQVGGSCDFAYSVAIQADGKIVAAGNSDNGVGNCSSAGTNFAVVRYNTNGTLDTTFNGTGKVVTPIGNNSGASSGASSVAIQADGRIVAAGYSSSFVTDPDFAVVRYNTNGSLDTSFNGTGKVLTPVGSSYDYAASVAIQADGKIVAAGSSCNGVGNCNAGTSFAVVRYNPNGSLDTTFNGTGKVVTPIGSNSGDSAASVAIQADGKIVAAGDSRGADYNFAVVRYNTNGTLDTSFNGTGKVVTAVGSRGDRAASVAIQPDGKIVAAGRSSNGSDHDFALVRYLAASNANIRTRFDFDGDGRADISLFRPSNGVWSLRRSSLGISDTQFGLSTDKITPADFDGDGRTDVAVYRDGFWYWLNSSNGSFQAAQFGQAGDIPVPADYTGDGRAELAVYRSGFWFTLNLANNQFNAVQFGNATDKPVAADYDGDGRTDYAVFRDGIWYLLQSTRGFEVIQFGLPTDRLVPADYNGDGKTDLAVYRDGTWYLRQSSQGFTAFQFGLTTDIPAPADYDGDGKADIAVYRDGVWYLLQSANGFAAQQFGLATDKPVPTAYLP
jgi:uncharacterized delta-60 repeat protein